MTDEDRVVVLLRLNPLTQQHVARNSVIITAACGHRAWISPSGLAFTLHDPTIRTSCDRCMPKLDRDTKIEEIPGSLDEVGAELGAEMKAQVEQWLRRHQ